MKIIRIISLAVVMMSLFTGAVTATPVGDEAQPVAPGTDQLVVLFAEETVGPAAAVDRRAALQASAARLSAGVGSELTFLRETAGGAAVLKLDRVLPVEAVQALAGRLAQQPGVLQAEPDWILQPAAETVPAAAPNDIFWSDLWGLAPYQAAAGQVVNAGIDVQSAWAITYGDPNLLVAVLDTGILKNHEDLQSRYRLGGADLGFDMLEDLSKAADGNGRDPDASDPGDYCTRGSSWHGSHVAGTIGAIGNNSVGVAGINWNSKIMPVRVLGRCGGSMSDVVEGIYWAVGAPLQYIAPNPYASQVKVLNLSLGGPYPCSSSMQTAIDVARARGVVVVTAAGNNSTDASMYMPGSCEGVITVAASTQNGSRANYSNLGSMVEISAPGGQIGLIDSTNNNDSGIFSTIDLSFTEPQGSYYGWMHGTSMAAPHVTGIVSLMFSANPRLTVDQVRQILQRSASPFSPASVCSTSLDCGAGIAHAGRAVQDAASFYWIEWPSAEGRYGMANAGDASAPNPITIITIGAANPRKTTVKIGGVAASVKNAVSEGGRDYLTVQPSAMLKNGRYDLEVTIDGAAHVQPQSVFFGPRVFLPSVVR